MKKIKSGRALMYLVSGNVWSFVALKIAAAYGSATPLFERK
jgi:hypothetical protein